MRRTLSVLLILGLLFGALMLPAEAKKKKKKKKKKQVKIERVVEWTYDAPALGTPSAGVCLVPTNSCARFPVGMKEKFVKIKIEDATGLPVLASVGQDLDGDGLTDVAQSICGESEEAIPVEPGYEITVFPWVIGSPDCPGIATSGTVTATHSNRP